MSPTVRSLRMPRVVAIVLPLMVVYAVFAFAAAMLFQGTLALAGVVGMMLRFEHGRAALWIVGLGFIVTGLFIALAAWSVRDLVGLDGWTFASGLSQAAIGVALTLTLVRNDVTAWLEAPDEPAPR